MAAEARYDMTVYPVQVAVRSASDGAKVHMVTLPYCDCADFTNRRGHLVGDAVVICKHLREALERVGGWHRAEPAPEPRYATVRGVSRQRARTLLAEAGLTGRETSDLLRAADGHRGLAAEASPGDGTAPRVTTYDEGRYEVSVPA